MKQSNKKTLICVLLCALFCAVTAFAFAGCKKTEATKKYAVIFMDGETQISEQTVEANKEAVKPADPTKESTVDTVFAFAGWSLTDGGETVTDFTIKADTTFYAVYTSVTRKYKVTFMNGSEKLSENDVDYNTTAAAPATNPSKPSDAGNDYTFAGWSLTENGETVTDFTIKADTTFYAVYTSVTKKYKVTFMNGSEKLSESDVDYNGVAVAPAQTPAKESTVDTVFVFAGWSLTDGGEKVDELKITGDTTFYAVYTSSVRKYNVQFVGDDLDVTVSVNARENVPALKDEEGARGRQIVGYYTDAAFTQVFDIANTAITQDTNVYVKLSDYVYFNGAMISKFDGGNATKTLNADGTATIGGDKNGLSARQLGLNLDLNDTDGIEIKVKVNGATGRLIDIWVIGDYVKDGVNGTLTAENGTMGYYRGLPTQGYTVTAEDSEGYVIMRFDFAYITNGKGAQNFNFTKMTGLRIDLFGLQSATVAYVKSIKIEKSYAVNYYVNGAVKKTATVKEGEKAIALKDEEGALGRQIVGYYTDAAFTQVFDIANTAITQDTNVYVKLSDYVYFNGAMISKFDGGNATKTLNADGTATIGGDKNGLSARQLGLNLDLNDTDGIEIKVKVNGATGRLIDIWVIGDYVKDGVNGTLTAENGTMGYYRGLPTQGYTVTAEDSEGYVIMRFDFAYITNGKGAQNFNFTKMTGLRIDLIGLQSATVAYVKSIKK